MMGLIKQELFKMKKDKSIRVALIVTLALSVFGVLTNMLLNVAMEEVAGEVLQGFVINKKFSRASLFSFVNNFGFILPVFLVIFLCKDFR